MGFSRRGAWRKKGVEMTVQFVEEPALILAAGQPVKEIREYFGLANTGTGELSIARMNSPAGWSEPGQTPEFNEYSVVLRGTLHLRLRDRELVVRAGQAVMVSAGEWVQYHTPDGAEYIAVCLPAFSPETVHRDE